MIDNRLGLEGLLQKLRFTQVLRWLHGHVLDFGGNRGELAGFVRGEYTVCNYDHSVLHGKRFDTIVALAVIEHIEVPDVFAIFRRLVERHLKPGGRVLITTPTRAAHPVLKTLASARLLDAENLAEHKHYWSERELHALARHSGLRVCAYRRFQMGFNQFARLAA